MLITKLLVVVLDLVHSFFSMFSFAFGMPTGGFLGPSVLDTFLDVFRLVDYFLPLSNMLVLLMVGSGVEITILVWRVVIRIKSFIPTMGN